MTSLQVKTLIGEKFALNENVIKTFQEELRGELVQPNDAAYEELRKVYNAMIDRHPGFIVRCANVADVINAVNFTRENHLRLAVRGGGHNGAGLGVCDGGLVIYL